MKTKLCILLLAVIFLPTTLVLAAGDSKDPKEESSLAAARAQIAEDAAFIRQINSDPKMTPDQKKTAVSEFIHKQNEKSK